MTNKNCKNSENLKEILLNEIEENIKRNNIIRQARIISSERLKKYSENWNTIFLWLNVIAIIGACLGISNIFGLLSQPHKTSKLITFVSTIFSLYVILLQDFVSRENYSERSLKLHYNQLNLKRIIIKLTHLKIHLETLCEKEVDKKFLEYFNGIINERQAYLSGYENHDSLDFDTAKKDTQQNSNLKISVDLSPENIQIFFQWIIIYSMIYFYLYELFKFRWFLILWLLTIIFYIFFKFVKHQSETKNQ